MYTHENVTSLPLDPVPTPHFFHSIPTHPLYYPFSSVSIFLSISLLYNWADTCIVPSFSHEGKHIMGILSPCPFFLPTYHYVFEFTLYQFINNLLILFFTSAYSTPLCRCSISLFDHSSTYHLGGFQYFAITNDATINNLVHM